MLKCIQELYREHCSNVLYYHFVSTADIDNLVNSSADNLQVDYTETNDLHFNSTVSAQTESRHEKVCL